MTKKSIIMKTAILGTGNLGRSIAKGLITNNAITTLYLTKRHLNAIQDFEGYKNVNLTSDNVKAVQNSDILISECIRFKNSLESSLLLALSLACA